MTHRSMIVTHFDLTKRRFYEWGYRGQATAEVAAEAAKGLTTNPQDAAILLDRFREGLEARQAHGVAA